MPQMMMTQPPLNCRATGSHRSRQDKITESATTYNIGFEFFAGGTIIAINMAYSAIPKADLTEAGSTELANAPRKVPRFQPEKEIKINPAR